jgi:K+-transporting ATPase KdpF subunit
LASEPSAQSGFAKATDEGGRVSGTGVFANVAGGVLALLLLVYLIYALVRPERF